MKKVDFKSEDFRLQMAGSEDTGVGAAYCAVVGSKREKAEEDLLDRPKCVHEGDISRDWRVQLGWVQALKWVESLPNEARRQINHPSTREEQ